MLKLTPSPAAAIGAMFTMLAIGALHAAVPELGKPVRLALGQIARFENNAIAVRFDAVDQDSRCPSDTRCIMAGDASVVISVATGTTRWRRNVLHTDAAKAASAVDVAGYRITLVALDPVPIATRQTRQEDYAVSINVTRTSAR